LTGKGSAHADDLIDMPVFLNAPDSFVEIPLEATYQAAWETVPRRWQRVIEPATDER
jgi:hypothetical protein